MKKRYETPTVQMMAFRYRDQVVAASGIAPQDLDDGGNGYYPYPDCEDVKTGIWKLIDGIWQWIFG